MKDLSELINTKEPGWDLVKQWIKEGKNDVEILPRDSKRADATLYNAQITTRSPMGAIIYETGGILVYHGWIRILGSGCKRLDRDIMSWNKGKSFKVPGEKSSFLLIADDALGGFYAINAGGLSSSEIGIVFYFAPDTLKWESTEQNYSQFLNFCFSGDLKKYYDGLQWNGWQTEISKMDGNKGIHCIPFLWTTEGKDINKDSRKQVPIQELWDLSFDIKNKLDGHK
ncbi:DUF2625 domain-containing protein [Mucilaginibacter sp. AW1-3]